MESIVGASIVLECEADGYPTPTITWKIPEKGKYHVLCCLNKIIMLFLKNNDLENRLRQLKHFYKKKPNFFVLFLKCYNFYSGRLRYYLQYAFL